MATLLMRLVGPMQSWGTASRFDQRDTGKEPSKSGVIGLLAAACGIDRENWNDLKPLTMLKMAVRHDRSGVLKKDYQTAGCSRSDIIMKADGKTASDGVVSARYYLADAAFLIGLEALDKSLLESIQKALQNPCWQTCLGRKSYLPAETIWLEGGLREGTLLDVMSKWPWISSLRQSESAPEKLLISFESKEREGVLRMDQPLSDFATRRFGARFVKSEWIPFPGEV